MQDVDPPIGSSVKESSRPARTTREIAARRRTIVVRVVLGVLALIALTGATVYFLWRMEPGYWQKNQAFVNSHDDATLEQAADAMERRILTGLSDPMPPAMTGNPSLPAPANSLVRTVHLSLDEMNAWLAANLDAWAANQNIHLPPQLSHYMISTEGDRLVLACQVDMPPISQVMSMVVSLRVLDDGKARVRVEGFRGGCLPLPAQFIAQRLRNNSRNGWSGRRCSTSWPRSKAGFSTRLCGWIQRIG